MNLLQNNWTSNSKFYRTPTVYVASTPNDLKELEDILSDKPLAFDLETVGLSFWKCPIMSVSFAVERGISYVLPIYLCGMVSVWKDESVVFDFLRKILGDPDTLKIGHNIKFDVNVLRYRDVIVEGEWYDTMVAYGLIDENAAKDLMTMADAFDLQYGKWDDKLLEYVTKKDPDFSKVPDNILHLYTGIDATATFELYEKSRRTMRKENVYDVFSNISMKLLHVVADMEYEGVLLDVPLLDKYSKEYAEKAEIKLQEIRNLTQDSTFNPNSPKQLGEKLAVSLAGGKKTATGRISTDEDALKGLVKKGNPLAKAVLELRGLVKTRSTFMEGFKKILDDRGYIHTNYSIAHTVTGRISSNHPNLQNIPRVREGEAKLRNLFTVEDGYSFVAADYAQMEQRIIALLSGDKNLESIFKNKQDIHRMVTSKILKKDPSLVTHEERAKGKGVVFGAGYGRSPEDIAREYGMDNEEARFFLEEYFKQFPDMAKWRLDRHKESLKNHLLVSAFGRKRRFVGYGFLQSPEANNILQKFEIKLALINMRNMAYNFPIQSSASDYLSTATYEIWKELKERNMKSKVIMSIHDAINLKVFNNELEEVTNIIKKHMEKILRKNGVEIPILADIKVGRCWEGE